MKNQKELARMQILITEDISTIDKLQDIIIAHAEKERKNGNTIIATCFNTIALDLSEQIDQGGHICADECGHTHDDFLVECKEYLEDNE